MVDVLPTITGDGGPAEATPVVNFKADGTEVDFSGVGGALVGSVTETAPVSDTASSGLNGRLQRIAQRITSLIALFTSDSNGTVVQPALSSTFWNYAAAAAGITNSAVAVTVKAAAAASVRNYISSMQVTSTALGAATELCIRDGAGGTVLWRGNLTTAGWPAGNDMVFDPPLRGTANTLAEVVTLTASVTGSVYVNLQGYTGA